MELPDLILGVDPGKMTGAATYDPAERALLAAWQQPNLQFQEWAWLTLGAEQTLGRRVLVACERFVISAGTVRTSRGDENWSIETIGVLRFACHRFGHELVLQSPGDAKKFAPDKRLREVGRHQKGRDHANDAIRHVTLAAASQLGHAPPWV